MGQVLSVKGGKRLPSGDSFSEEPTSHIYIRVSEMKNGTLVDKDLKYISDETFEKIKNYTISKSDLYLTIAGTIGAVGIVPEKFDGMNLTENAVKLTNLMIEKYYLFHIISSYLVQSQFIDKTKQVAQPKLAIERILTTLIPIPPLLEQRKIILRIEELILQINKYHKSKIELGKLESELKPQLKKSILQYAIQGKLVAQDPNDEPASELLKRIEAEKEQLIKDGKIKRDKNASVIFKGDDNKYYEKKGGEIIDITEEIPFEIPNSWEWSRLAMVSIIQEGPGIRSFQYKSEGVQLLTVTNILEGSVDLIKSKKFISESEYKEKYSHFQVNLGDIVCACSGGSWGKSAIYNIPNHKIILNTSTLRLRFFADIADNNYLYLITKTFLLKKQLSDQMSGMQPNFGYAHYSKILIPIPPLREQHRIVDRLDNILKGIEEL